MSLELGIKHGKEHRAPYRKSKRFDRTCRPGGSCPWCKRNRMIQEQRQVNATKEQEREWRDPYP